MFLICHFASHLSYTSAQPPDWLITVSAKLHLKTAKFLFLPSSKPPLSPTGGKTISNTNSNTSPYVINSGTTHQLIIKNIAFEDGGVYTCTATSQTMDNSAGSDDYLHRATDDVTLTIGNGIEYMVRDNGAGRTMGGYILLSLILAML